MSIKIECEDVTPSRAFNTSTKCPLTLQNIRLKVANCYKMYLPSLVPEFKNAVRDPSWQNKNGATIHFLCSF